MYRKYLKRPLDIVLSFCGLIVLAPVMLVLAFLVKTKLGSPVIFCQERPGKDEKIFKMYKFRSMTDARDENGELLPDDVRLTPFGKKLRSTSLDELPELWNILKGDMSVVGPRPLLVEYLPFYTEEERVRHSVRPGLTVPDVLTSKLICTWNEQFENDVNYCGDMTFKTDFIVFYKTFGKLFRRTQEDYGSFVREKLSVERERVYVS